MNFQPSSTKILIELREEKTETEFGIVVAQEGKRDFVVGKVIGVGSEVQGVKKGDELVVFNVYDAQIMNYEGKKLAFVVEKDAFYFLK